MNWGFMVLCSLLIAGWFIEVDRHGKPKTGKHNAWETLAAGIIEVLLILWAMHWRFV